MSLKRFSEVSHGGFLPRRIVRTGYVSNIPLSIQHMDQPGTVPGVIELERTPVRRTVLEYGADPKAPAVEVEIS